MYAAPIFFPTFKRAIATKKFTLRIIGASCQDRYGMSTIDKSFSQVINAKAFRIKVICDNENVHLDGLFPYVPVDIVGIAENDPQHLV